MVTQSSQILGIHDKSPMPIPRDDLNHGHVRSGVRIWCIRDILGCRKFLPFRLGSFRPSVGYRLLLCIPGSFGEVPLFIFVLYVLLPGPKFSWSRRDIVSPLNFNGGFGRGGECAFWFDEPGKGVVSWILTTLLGDDNDVRDENTIRYWIEWSCYF